MFKLGEIKFIHMIIPYGLLTWKGNCYYSFTDFFVALTINIHNEVSYNIECFNNFLPFCSIPYTISGAPLKEAGYLKIITFDSGNYLNMWVTFDVFTCNRMIKLKKASKRNELDCNNF